MTRPPGVERRNRRHAVGHTMIVHERGVQRFGQREASQRPAGRVIDGSLAADDVLAADQQDQDEINAVTMNAFRGRAARRVRPRLDSELVGFDVPPHGGWRQGLNRRSQNRRMVSIVGPDPTAVSIGENHRSMPPNSELYSGCW